MNDNEKYKLEYSFHEKGWGYEKWLVNNELYCDKILHIKSKKRCSWHYHKIKTESFFIQSGSVIIKYSWEDDINLSNEQILREGEAFHIPVGLRHMIIAVETSDILEVSTKHLEEDSYRIIRGD